MKGRSGIIAIEGAIYCQECAGGLSRRTPMPLALRYPASCNKKKKGTCRECGKEVRLCEMSKVIRKEIK